MYIVTLPRITSTPTITLHSMLDQLIVAETSALDYLNLYIAAYIRMSTLLQLIVVYQKRETMTTTIMVCPKLAFQNKRVVFFAPLQETPDISTPLVKPY